MASSKLFRVTWQPACIREVDELAKRLSSTSLKSRLKTLLVDAQRELAESPRTWGDPRQNLKGMNATVFVKTFLSDGIYIRYLVHRVEQFVFVQSVEPIPFGPFDI